MYATTFEELDIFVELTGVRSIRELARRRHMAPGQVSKLVRRLESKAGHKLVERSISGVVLTAFGHQFAEQARHMLDQLKILEEKCNPDQERQKVIGVGGISFLITHLGARAISFMEQKFPDLRLRLVEIPPRQLTGAGLRGAFEVALHLNPLDWPQSWESIKVGQVRWILCARKNHPLATRPSLKNILKYPFVYPAYWTPEGIVSGDDNCPLPIAKRKLGFETATAESALLLVENSDQLAFLPEILVRSSINSGIIREIPMKGWSSVKRTVHLSVRTDAVKIKFREGLAATFGQILKV